MVASPSTRAMGHSIQDCPGEEGALSPICISSHASCGRCGCSDRVKGVGSTTARAELGTGKREQLVLCWGLAAAPHHFHTKSMVLWRQCLMPLTAAPHSWDKDWGLTSKAFHLFHLCYFLFIPSKKHFSTQVSFLPDTRKSQHLPLSLLFHRSQPCVIAAVQYFLASTGN